jgi:hypothetical protein
MYITTQNSKAIHSVLIVAFVSLPHHKFVYRHVDINGSMTQTQSWMAYNETCTNQL